MCAELKRLATTQSVRDRALLVIGFGAALRASEAAELQLDDLIVTKKGAAVKIRASKGDQEGKGATVHIFQGKHGATDVLDTLRCWLQVRGKPDGPLFGIGDVCHFRRWRGLSVYFAPLFAVLIVTPCG